MTYHKPENIITDLKLLLSQLFSQPILLLKLTN